MRARSFFEKRYLVYQRQNRFETPTDPPKIAVAAVVSSRMGPDSTTAKQLLFVGFNRLQRFCQGYKAHRLEMRNIGGKTAFPSPACATSATCKMQNPTKTKKGLLKRCRHCPKKALMLEGSA